MSPEQVRGEALTERSDVFTLAVVFAEMLLGEPLFAHGTDLDVLLRIRDADLAVLLRSRRRIPADVRRLLMEALAHDPACRPSASGLCQLLEDVMACRGVVGDGTDVTAALIRRLGLIRGPAAPEHTMGTAASLGFRQEGRITSGALVSPDELGGAHAYTIEGRGGGPVPFPELARLCSTGVVEAATRIRRNRECLRAARELRELGRFFATPALQWSREEIRCPRLQGELGSAILLPLIHSLNANRETGMLFLEADGRRKKIYFVEGRPEFVASNERCEMLGDFLVAQHLCPAPDLDLALAVLARFDGRLGDALLRLGVLRPVELYRAVTSQVRARYLDAFRWRSGTFRYVREARSREDTYPIDQDAHVLMRDAAAELDPSELEAALSPLWEKVLRRSAAPPAPVSAYQLPDAWRWVIEQVRGQDTVGSMFGRCVMQTGLDEDDAMRSLFLGISCQLLEAAA